MINLSPVIGSCFDFTQEGKRERVTTIVTPIIIKDPSSGKISVSWACSRGRVCRNTTCLYSFRGSPEESKGEKVEQKGES